MSSHHQGSLSSLFQEEEEEESQEGTETRRSRRNGEEDFHSMGKMKKYAARMDNAIFLFEQRFNLETLRST